MTKRVGVLSLILAAGMAIFQPVAALAQDRARDYGFRDQSPRREQRAFREQGRNFRTPLRRERELWRAPRASRYFVDRSYGRGYAAPRYNSYYYQPVRPYNCR